MAEELPQNLELRVLELIKGAFRSREVLEAERPNDAPPVDDDRAMLQNLTEAMERQGMILAHLSIVPSTRAELMTRLPGMANRVPVWLDAHLEGNRPMTWRLFMQGLAQIQSEHREAIERVVAEQVEEAGEIEEALTEAPVPAGTPGEVRRDLMSGVFRAMTAHTKALVDIAYDLETQLRG
jgi:hypothetical protein